MLCETEQRAAEREGVAGVDRPLPGVFQVLLGVRESSVPQCEHAGQPRIDGLVPAAAGVPGELQRRLCHLLRNLLLPEPPTECSKFMD